MVDSTPSPRDDRDDSDADDSGDDENDEAVGGDSGDEGGAEYECSENPSDDVDEAVDPDELPLTQAFGISNEQFTGARGMHHVLWGTEELEFTVHPFEGSDRGEVDRDDERLTRADATALPHQPVDYFEMFITQAIFLQILTATNKYANYLRAISRPSWYPARFPWPPRWTPRTPGGERLQREYGGGRREWINEGDLYHPNKK